MRIQEVEDGHIFGREEVLYILYGMSICRGFYLPLEAPPAADISIASKLCRRVIQRLEGIPQTGSGSIPNGRRILQPADPTNHGHRAMGIIANPRRIVNWNPCSTISRLASAWVLPEWF